MAEQRRLKGLTPEEFAAEWRAAFGFDMGEWPEPPPYTAVHEPTCWRCGAVTGPAMAWGEIRQLPYEELVRLYFDAL